METALVMSGQEGHSEAAAEDISGEACYMSIGGGSQVCWYCSGLVGVPTPLPPTPIPTGPYGSAASCLDLVTPESIGVEEYERFGMAALLEGRQDKLQASMRARTQLGAHDAGTNRLCMSADYRRERSDGRGSGAYAFLLEAELAR
jgi:hypothetical protein